jgi:hypothetical protein
MDYISVREAAAKWSISERRIQKLCEEGRVPGSVRFVRVWAIPKDAKKPQDARLKTERKTETPNHDK